MPFRYVLANLLAEVEQAVGVLFIDDSGETVDLACSHASPFEIKVVGAYLGIHLRQLHEFAEEQQLGTARLLHIERDRMNIYALAVEDGYFLALVQQGAGLVSKTRDLLQHAADQLRCELFPETLPAQGKTE